MCHAVSLFFLFLANRSLHSAGYPLVTCIHALDNQDAALRLFLCTVIISVKAILLFVKACCSVKAICESHIVACVSIVEVGG